MRTVIPIELQRKYLIKMQTINKTDLGGIVFFQTKILNDLSDFYLTKIGCKLWLDKGGCQIYQHGNMLFGFCQREKVDNLGMITFFYKSESDID